MENAHPPDLARRVENLIRQGVIDEINFGLGVARVRIGGILTAPLPWHTLRAGTRKVWNPPSVGEQVTVLSSGGDYNCGVILLGLSSDTNPAPSSDSAETLFVMADGAQFSYNETTGHLVVTGIKSADITASGTVAINAGSLKITAATELTGPVKITGPVTQTGGPLTSNGKTLDTHSHTGVKGGGDTSGPPA